MILADLDLAKAMVMEFVADKSKVEFQFPPKFMNDSRKATWKEMEYATQTEPIVVYASSGPRELTMQITYIYDGDDQGDWNCAKISKQVRLIRGYFQRVKDANQQRNLAIRMAFWCIGGSGEQAAKTMSFRLKSCDVKYSETMIFPRQNPSGAWPLRTDIICDLATWTQGTAQAKDQPLEGLLKTLPPEWY